ncbi:MAG TPA: carboxypeptidase regulatory-like domain-containing protein, partial [Thermomicrobiaceae bacterium]|nr:carboxypeptidase regulatory-like domain-containing protein [Thermomicrobiaceae bacterium]
VSIGSLSNARAILIAVRGDGGTPVIDKDSYNTANGTTPTITPSSPNARIITMTAYGANVNTGSWSWTSPVGWTNLAATQKGANQPIVICDTRVLATPSAVSEQFSASAFPISAIFALLSPVGSVSGTVTDSVTGLAIQGATISLNDAAGSSTTTDASGNYEIDGVLPGTYTATISKATYITKTQNVTITAGQTTTANIGLTPAAGTLSGKVTNSYSGRAVQGATVSLSSGGGSTTTDASGTYTISNVPAGSYTATISAANYTTQTQPVTINGGQTTTKNIALIHVLVTLSDTDTGKLSAAETLALYGTLHDTDAGAFSGTEAAESATETFRLRSDNDSGTFTAAETGEAVSATVADGDDGAFSLTGAESLTVTLADADGDAVSLSVAEAESILELQSVSDTDAGAFNGVESQATISASLIEGDTGNLTAAEAEETISAALEGSDAGNLTAISAETPSVTLSDDEGDAGSVTADDSGESFYKYVTRDDTDTGSLTAAEQVQVAAQPIDTDDGSLGASEADMAVSGLVVNTDGGSLTLASTEALSATPADADGDTGNLYVTASEGIAATIGDPDGDRLTLAIDETNHVRAHVISADSGKLSGAESGGKVREITISFEHRLRLDVLDASGNVIAGPFANVLAASYHLKLDEIGDWSADLPMEDERVLSLTTGQRVIVTREGEGQVFSGIIDSVETIVDASGAPKITLKGASTAEQLVWANTLLGRVFDNATPTNAVTTLLSGTGWSKGSVGTSPNGFTAQFDGVSIFKALTTLAQSYGWHVREDPLSRVVDIVPAGGASGLRAANVDQASDDLAMLPLTAPLQITSEQPDLWNRVIPLGDGEGINRLSLQYSTRTGPYPIKTATGPDGNPYWYIEDTASITAHQARVMPLPFKDVTPLDNSSASITSAANALYDLAAAWLTWHSQPQESYQIGVANLTHYQNGQPAFKLGQTMHLR